MPAGLIYRPVRSVAMPHRGSLLMVLQQLQAYLLQQASPDAKGCAMHSNMSRKAWRRMRCTVWEPLRIIRCTVGSALRVNFSVTLGRTLALTPSARCFQFWGAHCR